MLRGEFKKEMEEFVTQTDMDEQLENKHFGTVNFPDFDNEVTVEEVTVETLKKLNLTKSSPVKLQTSISNYFNKK